MAELSDLPTLSVSINCGVCYATVDHDGDNYVCHYCGLMYDSDPFSDEPAWFLDEDKAACGHEPGVEPWTDRRPFETVNGVVKSWRIWAHAYQPCALPEGHKSDHDHQMKTTSKTEVAS